MKANFSAFTLIASMLALTACSNQKKFDEMHDATLGLSNKTERLTGLTQGLSKTVNTTVEGLRDKEAMDIRDASIPEIKNDNPFSQKLEKAAIYFGGGFTFQMWTGEGDDTVALRNEMFEDSLKSFFGEMEGFMPQDRNPDPMALENQNKSQRDLFAIAAMMDTISPKQKTWAQINHFVPMSMLSLIEDTLKNRTALESDPANALAYQREIIGHARDAIYLLQLRNNFIPTMVLGRLSKHMRAGGVMSALMVMWNKTFHWKAESSILTNMEISELADWMHEANRTRLFLKDLVPEFDTEGNELELSKTTRNEIKTYTRINPKLLDLYKTMRLLPEKGDSLTINGLVTPNTAAEVRMTEYLRLEQEISIFIAGQSEERV